MRFPVPLTTFAPLKHGAFAPRRKPLNVIRHRLKRDWRLLARVRRLAGVAASNASEQVIREPGDRENGVWFRDSPALLAIDVPGAPPARGIAQVSRPTTRLLHPPRRHRGRRQRITRRFPPPRRATLVRSAIEPGGAPVKHGAFAPRRKPLNVICHASTVAGGVYLGGTHS